MSPLVTIDQINEMLADRLEELLPLLVAGRAVRGEWISASTKDGGLGDSLTVALKGRKRGAWYHHAAGVGGDPLGLVNYARFHNADMKAALAWAREFLGGAIEPDSERAHQRRQRRAAAVAAEQERDERNYRGRARYLWLVKAQDLPGTPAWHYLNNRLGGYLPRLGRLPRALRYVPNLYNAQIDVELPALVGGVVDLAGELIALHRTWLVRRGLSDDTWDRLRESDTKTFGPSRDGKELVGKKVMGASSGGAIRLWRAWPHRAADENRNICLTEGIETGLTLALLKPEWRIASVLSCSGFAGVELPAEIRHVTIAADNDPDNKATKIALAHAAAAIAEAGREGAILFPPVPFKDWNDVLGDCIRRAS